MHKILIGSPIRQKPNILKQFLSGLTEADYRGLDVAYYFVDDNKDNDSSGLLFDFLESNKNVIIKKGSDLLAQNVDSDYVCSDDEHHWKSENITRITIFKDSIIEYCIAEKFDYLFLVDSDIVIDKRSVKQLISRNVDIVSNVFWTQWQINKNLSPQCFWIPDLYQQNIAFNEKMPVDEANRIRSETDEKLKKPGIYKVDGLGACTMISLSALKKGVRFKEIPNLSVPGEDRHFCIRAGSLGIDLFMDTVYPVYHIYREEYLDRVNEFKSDGFKFDMCQTFLDTDDADIDMGKSMFYDKIYRKLRQIARRVIKHKN